MEEYVKNNNGGKHKILKGIGIAIGATAIAVVSYIAGSGKRAAYTLGGVAALIAVAPTFNLLRSCSDNHYKLKQQETIYEFKKDSLDLVKSLNAPKDTIDISDLLIEREKYKVMESQNSVKYETQLKEKEAKYTASVNALGEKYEKLENKLENLKQVQSAVVPTDYSSNSTSIQGNNQRTNRRATERNNSTTAVSSNYASNNSSDLERIASTHNVNENPNISGIQISYYLIDADKSEGEIQVYGVCSDGSLRDMGVSSKASFARNGGPANGSYVLKNKGARSGELYPGFLEMSDPIGISGAGEYNQHLKEIQEGAYVNNTGIRVPTEIHYTLTGFVNQKRTEINVHE